MQVRSSAGKRLENSIRVHVREQEVYLQVAAAFDAWKPWRAEGGWLSFPVSAIAKVQGA